MIPGTFLSCFRILSWFYVICYVGQGWYLELFCLVLEYCLDFNYSCILSVCTKKKCNELIANGNISKKLDHMIISDVSCFLYACRGLYELHSGENHMPKKHPFLMMQAQKCSKLLKRRLFGIYLEMLWSVLYGFLLRTVIFFQLSASLITFRATTM